MADYGNLELSPAGDRVGVAVLSDSERGTRRHLARRCRDRLPHRPHVGRRRRELDAVVERRPAHHVQLRAQRWPRLVSDRVGGHERIAWRRSARRSRREMAGELVGRRPLPALCRSTGSGPVTTSSCCRSSATGSRFRSSRPTESENWAAFSPDGKWVAYSSTEAGDPEVYVSAFPPVPSGRRWLVSKGGGTQARWRRDGKELYFLSPERMIVAAVVSAAAPTSRSVRCNRSSRFVYPTASITHSTSRPTVSGFSSTPWSPCPARRSSHTERATSA